MGEFDGRRVLVTGAAGGLGTALCSVLVAEGAHVIATDLSPEKGDALRAATGAGRLDFHQFDQSMLGRIPDFAHDLVRGHGTIDSLVNNAAVYPSVAADEMDLADLQRVLTVNVEASAAFMQALAPAMKAAGHGRIINVASITFDLGFKNLSAYVASKGALIGLVRSWARELGPYGVTVNAISPGAFQTDAEKIHPDPEGYNRFVLDQQALKRRGKPEDFANLACFLLGERASFITGQNIRVDGGWVMS